MKTNANDNIVDNQLFKERTRRENSFARCSKFVTFILDIEEQIGRRNFVMNFQDSLLQRRGAYLCDHHNDEAVLNNLVVGDRFSLILHDFTVSDEFLSCGFLSVRLLDKRFQSCDLNHKHTQIQSIKSDKTNLNLLPLSVRYLYVKMRLSLKNIICTHRHFRLHLQR